MLEELQEKVLYLYMTFGLKIGVCLCAKALCPNTDSVKFSGSFVLMWNRIVLIVYRLINFLYFQKSGPTIRIIAVHCINLELSSQLTSSSSLAKPDAPFTQYMASKPDKSGQKYWLAVDKESKYVINGFPFVWKDEMRSSTERVSDRVVMELMRPNLCKGRNVTTDIFHFSEISQSVESKSKQEFWEQ